MNDDLCEPCSYHGDRREAVTIIGTDFTPVCRWHTQPGAYTRRAPHPSQVPSKHDLFQAGDFTLASGEKSAYKIECDALGDAELRVLAGLLAERVPPFRSVWGVPTGGLRVAAALMPYCTADADIVLLADDVWTTGGSMYRFAPTVTHDPGPHHGAVLFARGETPKWVTALFTMSNPWP